MVLGVLFGYGGSKVCFNSSLPISFRDKMKEKRSHAIKVKAWKAKKCLILILYSLGDNSDFQDMQK